MPSQVVQTIDGLFPHAKKNQPAGQLSGSQSQLRGILNLLSYVPDELKRIPIIRKHSLHA
jgi:hypothetical protein